VYWKSLRRKGWFDVVRKIITTSVKVVNHWGNSVKIRMKGYEGNLYQQHYDEKEKKWIYTHRKVAKKKYGDLPKKDFHVHHIDGNRKNNKPDNLILLHKKDHRRVHLEKTLKIIKV
jgi:hypothetical protein